MLDSTIINTQELAEKLNIQELIEKVIEERGHVNILIAGRSGVGKSTLINAVFGADIAKVGQGKPVSHKTLKKLQQKVILLRYLILVV
jgi:predicted GTPase